MDAKTGETATQYFQEDLREMLLSFDNDAVFSAIAAWCRTEGIRRVTPDDDEENLQILLAQGFTSLYNRGAIVAVRPFSIEGRAQLDRLLSTYRITAADQKPVPVVVDPLLDVVADFNGRISTAEFKKKCQGDPEYFKLYERACSEGRL